jgi:hypothetical protein
MLPVRIPVGSFLGIDAVSHANLALPAMEAEDVVANCSIRSGESLALAKIVDPRLHDESFGDAAGIVDVLEDAPSHGAIAHADISELVNGVNELVVFLWLDAIFDQDSNWAFVHFRLKRRLGDSQWVARWREVG